jgi:hypothetical protein
LEAVLKEKEQLSSLSVQIGGFMMLRSVLTRVLFLLAVLPTAVTSAQTFGGVIAGTITDPSKKSIADAAVLIQVEIGAGKELIARTPFFHRGLGN